MNLRAALRLLTRYCLRFGPILAALCVVLLLCDETLARAGGGQGYSGGRSGGGGGRGGGGGGGGGDGGGLIYLLIQLLHLCVSHPHVGIPILVIIVGFFVYAYWKGKDAFESSVIRKAGAARDLARTPSIVSAIQANDPAFDAEALLARVRGAFVKIQHAWAQQNLAEVRPFISDAVYERFSLQFDEQKALGYRNKMDAVNVTQTTLANGRSDELFDELDIRIAASAVDQKVSLKDGKVLSGAGSQAPFVEIWSFLRRRGATTKAGAPGLMEGNCPNCGAAIEMNQSANCQYCGAMLRSGQYDWVLVEITQECEYEPSKRDQTPGVATLRQRDPQFNPQELEDRASVIFWRRATANRLNAADPLRKVSLPAYCERFDERAKSQRGQRRHYYGECAVGSVELLGVLPAGRGNGNEPGDAMDRALVEVKWSGQHFTAEPDGRLIAGEQSAVSQTLFVLTRQSSAKSNPDKSVSSAHCPNCGAPETGGSSGACEFCGEVLNDASKQWALEDDPGTYEERGKTLLTRLRWADNGTASAPVAPPIAARAVPGSSPAAVLAWMVKMTLADGELEPRERELLITTAQRYGVPESRLDQMIAAAQANTLDLPQPANRNEAQEHLQSMARAALADGKISSEEYALLLSAGERLGLKDYDVKQLLRQTKAQMYAEAQSQIRSARNGNGRSGWAQ
jgi:uncharacterized tellurite resistance protein B-like protein/predicted nucleic acid-binding Zn ribbon protein